MYNNQCVANVSQLEVWDNCEFKRYIKKTKDEGIDVGLMVIVSQDAE